jgi:hypothetical protein
VDACGGRAALPQRRFGVTELFLGTVTVPRPWNVNFSLSQAYADTYNRSFGRLDSWHSPFAVQMLRYGNDKPDPASYERPAPYSSAALLPVTQDFFFLGHGIETTTPQCRPFAPVRPRRFRRERCEEKDGSGTTLRWNLQKPQLQALPPFSAQRQFDLEFCSSVVPRLQRVDRTYLVPHVT